MEKPTRSVPKSKTQCQPRRKRAGKVKRPPAAKANPADIVPSVNVESSSEAVSPTEALSDNAKGLADRQRHDKAAPNTSTSFSHASETIMIETTFDANRDPQLMFAICANGGPIKLDSSWIFPNMTRLEPPNDLNGLIAHGTVLFPSAALDYGTEADLDADLIAYFHRYMDVEPFWERLFGAYAKLSWIYQRFSAVPYLRLLGEYAGGKTRMAHVLSAVCYRGMAVAGAVTSAVMFRMTHLFQGTLFLDEADFKDSALWSDVIKVLNAGYKKGGFVLRCDKDNNPEAFGVYGPKIITTRTQFQDKATESRCLTLEVIEKANVRKDILYQLPASFDAETQRLRNKLLMWRFRNYRRMMYDEFRLRSAGLEPRVVEIATPLVAVSGPAFATELIEFLRIRTNSQRSDRPQAFIVGGMRALMHKRKLSEDKNLEDVLALKDIAQQASLLKAQQEPDAAREALAKAGSYGGEPQFFTAKRTGSLLRNMGFKPERIRDGENTGFHIVLNAHRLRELVEQYDPPDVEDRQPIFQSL